MSQNPPWGQSGPPQSYPQQPGQQPGQQPQQSGPPQGGWSPQQGGYQGPQGYPAQGQVPPQGGYAPVPGGYQQGPPSGQGGYQQGPSSGQGYGAAPPQAGGPYAGGPGGPPKKKSGALIIGIVAAGVALLVLVGGIFMVLGRSGSEPDVTITPGQPTEQPTGQPTNQPTDQPSQQPTDQPTDQPSSAAPSQDPTSPPTGDRIDLGNGISLTPASGWSVRKRDKGVAQLSNGEEIFLGQAAKTDPSTNPGQLCTAWHKQVAESASGGKFSDPKVLNLGTGKLAGASCLAQVTVSSGQGSAEIFLFSVASVRESDGVTVLATVYFTKSGDTEAVNKDFTAMTNSMLRTQAAG